MGCHTWIKSKVFNMPSEDIMFKYFTKITYDDGINQNGYWDLKEKWLSLWSTDTRFKNSQNKSEYTILDYSKVPEEIKMLAYPSDEHYEITEADFDIEFDETGTYIMNGYHDIFRLTGYPDVRLHTYEECEQFINSYDQVDNKQEILDICKKFYDKHPDTLIRFG